MTTAPLPPGDDLSRMAERMSPQAQQALRAFLSRVHKVEAAISATPLSVIVWGPGGSASGDPLHRKRVQLREALLQADNAAIFSEQLASSHAPGISPEVGEFAEADAADWIVILVASWGSLAEQVKFGGLADVGSKMLVLLPETSKGGFAEAAISGAFSPKVVYFTQQAFEQCRLIAEVMKWVPKLKAAKYQYLQEKRRWEGEQQ